MSSNRERRSGGRILVDQLIAQGVERLTCVPGESYLAVLDALMRMQNIWNGRKRRMNCPEPSSTVVQ